MILQYCVHAVYNTLLCNGTLWPRRKRALHHCYSILLQPPSPNTTALGTVLNNQYRPSKILDGNENLSNPVCFTENYVFVESKHSFRGQQTWFSSRFSYYSVSNCHYFVWQSITTVARIICFNHRNELYQAIPLTANCTSVAAHGVLVNFQKWQISY